jgi:hypothetical protein
MLVLCISSKSNANPALQEVKYKRVQMNKASLQKLNIAQAYPSLPIVDYVPFLDGGRKLDERKGKFGVCSNSLGKGSEFANSLGERDVV